MPWAAGSSPGQPASPRRGKGSSRIPATTEVFLPGTNLTKSSEAVGEERGDDEKEEEEEEKEEKETTFIEASAQLRARPLSPLVVHSRGGEDEGGEEEGEEDSLDYSTEETPVVRILKVLFEISMG